MSPPQVGDTELEAAGSLRLRALHAEAYHHKEHLTQA